MKKLILTSLLLIFSFTVFSQNTISQLDKITTANSQSNKILSAAKSLSIAKPVETNTVKIKVSKKDKLQPKSIHFIKQVYGSNRKLIRIA